MPGHDECQSSVIPGRSRSLRTRNPATCTAPAYGFRVRRFAPSRN